MPSAFLVQAPILSQVCFLVGVFQQVGFLTTMLFSGAFPWPLILYFLLLCPHSNTSLLWPFINIVWHVCFWEDHSQSSSGCCMIFPALGPWASVPLPKKFSTFLKLALLDHYTSVTIDSNNVLVLSFRSSKKYLAMFIAELESKASRLHISPYNFPTKGIYIFF